MPVCHKSNLNIGCNRRLVMMVKPGMFILRCAGYCAELWVVLFAVTFVLDFWLLLKETENSTFHVFSFYPNENGLSHRGLQLHVALLGLKMKHFYIIKSVRALEPQIKYINKQVRFKSGKCGEVSDISSSILLKLSGTPATWGWALLCNRRNPGPTVPV